MLPLKPRGQHPLCKSQSPNHNLLLPCKWTFQLKTQPSLTSSYTLKTGRKILQVKQYISFHCKPPPRRQWLHRHMQPLSMPLPHPSPMMLLKISGQLLCCNKSLQLHPHGLRFWPHHGVSETCRKGVGHSTPCRGHASWAAEAGSEDPARLSATAWEQYSPTASAMSFSPSTWS